MTDRENSNLGEEIQDIVQNAVSTMDFRKLNSEITSTVNTALTEVRQALGIQTGHSRSIEEHKPGSWRPVGPQRTEHGDNHNRHGHSRQAPYRDQKHMMPNSQASAGGAGQPGRPGMPGKSFMKNAADMVGNRMNNRQEPRTMQQFQDRVKVQPAEQGRKGVPIPYVPVGSVKATLFSVFGGIGAGVFGVSLFVMSILAMTIGEEVFQAIAFGMFWPFLLSITMLCSGSSIRSRLRRMKSYLKVVQVRGFGSLKELANATGSTEKYVSKDIKKMLSLGMFPEGQLDAAASCFMATRRSCDMYQIAQNGYKQREEDERARIAELKRQEAKKARQGAPSRDAEAAQPLSDWDKLPAEVREAIESGRKYMAQIKEANEAMPNGELSDKLDRLELVVDRILLHVEKHPGQLSEIRKFMEYYLPTTQKLLDAYREFDAQPVQGDNITAAKDEIRDTLDTINTAFENLFDSLFEDAAMDVSTDISVLQTMLKQEGLTGSDFEPSSNPFS